MAVPLRPSNESQRLAALRAYELLDTLPEAAYDDLTALAAHLCGAPMAMISLLDKDRQWLKSAIGLPFKETPRDISFCGHAILQPHLFIVPDALDDERFASNPLVVEEPRVRFYAGAPLVTARGEALGTLCVMDRASRELTPEQEEGLRILGRQVMAQFELRRRAQEVVGSERRLVEVFRSCPVPFVIHRESDRTIVDANTAFADLFGWTREEICGRTSRELGLLDEEMARRLRTRLREDGGVRGLEIEARARDGSPKSVLMSTEIADLRGEPHALTTLLDITARKQAARATAHLAAIVESSQDAIIGKDLEGTIETWNSGAERLFGYSAAEMIGTSILRLIPDDRREEEAQILDRIRLGKSVQQLETVRQAKDGRQLDVSITASPIKDADGRLVGASKVARDIGDRKRAERALRESEEQLRLYIQQSPVAVAMLDNEMRYLVASDRWIEDFRLGTAPVVGRSHYELFPDLPQRWIDVHRRCLAGATERCDEDPFVRDDGRTDWIRWEIRPWLRTDGTVGGIILFSEDISARKAAAAALRASEARYRTLFDYAPDGILIADKDGTYVDANAAMCRMLGYEREELLGRTAVDIAIPEETGNIEPALEKLNAGIDYQREWRFRRKDGSVFASDVIGTRMPDGHILAMFRDVTERNRATEALRVAEERMRFALESADIGIWDMDYSTGKLRWSAQLEAHYGYSPGTFPGTVEAFTEGIHPADRAGVVESVERAMKTGSDFTLEHRVCWRDGTVRWLTGAGRIQLGSNGKPMRGVGISMDVTARRTLETQYQQAQKMEAIGRLAGGVAHDFNNLLTTILGYCELILGTLAPSDPLRADVSEIQRAGMSAAALTRQLLAFSRKQIIEPTLLDLNTVIESMLGMVGRLLGEDIEVAIHLAPAPSLVVADRAQIEQVLLNLAVNSRDAMPDGGRLGIETAQVDLDEHFAMKHFDVKPGPYVVLSISDTGTGMTSEVQSHLFEPFFTTKEQGKGTGLGLATVHGIVTRAGG
jgi:two-component system cell cycle sensor histidine kinase/response regulator CckA